MSRHCGPSGQVLIHYFLQAIFTWHVWSKCHSPISPPCTPPPPPGLAYCRHLSTVRTHLSALVNHNIVPPDKPCEASGGLSKDVWSKYQKDCKVCVWVCLCVCLCLFVFVSVPVHECKRKVLGNGNRYGFSNLAAEFDTFYIHCLVHPSSGSIFSIHLEAN